MPALVAGVRYSVDRRVAEAPVRAPAQSGAVQVLALTKYGRFGSKQPLPLLELPCHLRERNIVVTERLPSSAGQLSPGSGLPGATIDYVDVARSYTKRLAEIAGASRFEVPWIEAELLPRWPASLERLLRMLGRRFVVDLDDAIFHSYDRHPSPTFRKVLGRKIDLIFQRAEAVVQETSTWPSGPARPARAASYWCQLSSTTVPMPNTRRHPHDKLTFGWIGSSATEQYLQTIDTELDELCNSLPARLHLIGLDRHNFTASDVVLSRWSEDTEIEELAACDIGLAPLSDGPWERGKCGIKAIQYMASGIPVLAADVGALPTVVKHGETGFIYRDGAEFARYARQLADDPELRRRMGAAGRERVAACYSIHGWIDTIADVLTGAASR